MMAALHAADRTQSTVPISTPGDAFAGFTGGVGMDDDGNGVAAWADHTGPDPFNGRRAQYAGFDAAGPRIVSVTAPEEGKSGESLSFAVDAVDVWSTFTTAWEFGDGGTASGASASHAYGAGGSFKPKVTATDAVGNATSAERSLTVAGPPPPGGGGTPPGGNPPPPGVTPPAADRTAPVFTARPRVRPTRVRSGRTATISFSLSEAAAVRVTLTLHLKPLRRP